MTASQKSILAYLAAALAVVILLVLHFAASEVGAFSLRLRVERVSARTRVRTYAVQFSNAKSGAPLSDATVWLITQPLGSGPGSSGPIETVVLAPESKDRGTYLAEVPFSQEGDWWIHIRTNRPFASEVSFSEGIHGTELGPPLPFSELEVEPAGRLTLRTLADGYAFLTHLLATATLGVALGLMFIATRSRRPARLDRMALGTHLFWASTVVLVSTGLYNFVYHTISEVPIPLSLDLGETWRRFSLSNYGDAYATILALKHVAIIALLGAGAVITRAWRAARGANLLEQVQKILPTATTLAVALGTFILVLGGALVYLHAISEH